MYSIWLMYNRFITYIIPVLSIIAVILPWIRNRKRIAYTCDSSNINNGFIKFHIVNQGLSSIDADDVYDQKLYIDNIEIEKAEVQLHRHGSDDNNEIHNILPVKNNIWGKESNSIVLHFCKSLNDIKDDKAAVYIPEPFRPKDWIELKLFLKKRKKNSTKNNNSFQLKGSLRGFGARINYYNVPFIKPNNYKALNIFLTSIESLTAAIVIFIIISLAIINSFVVYKPEKEDNNTIETATAIKTNRHYRGKLSNSFESEQDWYMFSLDVPSKVEFRFKSQPQINSDGLYWDIRIRSEKDSKANPDIDPLVWRTFISGETGMFVSRPYSFFPAGNYYLGIESADYYTADTYSFILKSEPYEVDWECEPNNSMEHANNVAIDKTIYGRLTASFKDEKDWYYVEIKEKSKITLQFDTLRQHSDYEKYWDIRFMNEDQAKIVDKKDLQKPLTDEEQKNMSLIWRKLVTGDETNTTYTSADELEPGRYYVKIESSDKFSRDYYSLKLSA